MYRGLICSWPEQVVTTRTCAPKPPSNEASHFPAQWSRRHVAPLYAKALACSVPSISYETVGMVFIEAFNRRTPAVIRDLAPMPDIVGTRGGGLVDRNLDELVDHLHRSAAQPRLRRERGDSRYRAFLGESSPRAHLQRYFGSLHQTATKKFVTSVGNEPAEHRSSKRRKTVDILPNRHWPFREGSYVRD